MNSFILAAIPDFSYRSPMDIIYSGENHIYFLESLGNITPVVNIIKAIGFFIVLIAVTWVIVHLYFERNPQRVAEHKANIEHKLAILFIIASLGTLYDNMKNIFDTIFF